MSLYVFSKEAENDLREIYCYSFLNYGENKADLYVNDLKDKCQLVSSNPYLYRERTEFTPPVRFYHYKKHLIIYTIETDYILIVRIQHERMNIPHHLDV